MCMYTPQSAHANKRPAMCIYRRFLTCVLLNHVQRHIYTQASTIFRDIRYIHYRSVWSYTCSYLYCHIYIHTFCIYMVQLDLLVEGDHLLSSVLAKPCFNYIYGSLYYLYKDVYLYIHTYAFVYPTLYILHM